MSDPLQTIEVHPAGTAVASIIVLHGLGADGTDFLPFADEGDSKISEVISKILLLLSDNTIKDRSILSQIRSALGSGDGASS